MSASNHDTDSIHTPVQGRNFQVVHLRNPALVANISYSFDLLGIYPTLATAQRIASRALGHAIDEYQDRGYHGRFCDEINLRCKGMITAYNKSSGTEIGLSEFHINQAYLGSAAVVAGESLWVGPGDDANTQGGYEGGTAQWGGCNLHMPPLPVQPLRFKKQNIRRMICADHCWVCESAPLWARSRVPLFDRRDDAPFRNEDEPPYETRFAVACLPTRNWSEGGSDEGEGAGALDLADENV